MHASRAEAKGWRAYHAAATDGDHHVLVLVFLQRAVSTRSHLEVSHVERARLTVLPDELRAQDLCGGMSAGAGQCMVTGGHYAVNSHDTKTWNATGG